MTSKDVRWNPVAKGKIIDELPQLFWNTGLPWREANLWALQRATSRDVRLRTVQADATSMHAYANWLEATKTDWRDFPTLKKQRCLVRYRGDLIDARDGGELAPSTTTQRMQVVIKFYRWLRDSGLFSPTWPLWQDRNIGIRIIDSVGFERTLSVKSSDLSIPNRSAPGERLEGGLLPIRASDRDAALDFAYEHASEELFLMLTIGFFTGMRIGTITDLKVSTLDSAVPDPVAEKFFRLAVGPGATPPVATKFGVTGHISIARAQLDRLREYAYSVRRLQREAKASFEHKDLVFLTRFGNPYCRQGSERSGAINVEMHAFRKLANAHGLSAMRDFHFHQSRCTFATELATLAIRVGGPMYALSIVKKALLHKNEATALRYIKFVEETPIKQEAANAFTREFLGLLCNR